MCKNDFVNKASAKIGNDEINYGLSLDNTVSGSMLKKLQDKVAHSGDLTPESIKELFKTTTYEMLLNEISLYDLTGNLNLSKLYELEVKVLGNF